MKNDYLNSKGINLILDKKIKEMSFSGAAIDSKQVKKSNIFFALKGKNTDGHHYLNEAFKNGASLAIVEKIQRKIKHPQIKVHNVHRAMINLAKYYRNELKGTIIAITGSVGKTGTKDALSKIIAKKYKIFCSRKSYNNNIGLPLEILNMSKKDDIGIFELGMNHKNELSKLTKILQPDISCILNIAFVHGGNFKSIQDIALAKSEILNSSRGLKSIILNRDDKYFSLMKRESKKNYFKPIISFGKSKDSNVQLKKVIRKKNKLFLSVSLQNAKIVNYTLPNTHEHLISNSLAIISSLQALNLKTSFIKDYGKLELTSGRGNLLKIKKGNQNFKIIDHSYNASPESYFATLKSFNNQNNNSKIYIIGEMFELGKKSHYYHNSLFRLMTSFNSKHCYYVGKQFNLIRELSLNKKNNLFHDVNELIDKFNYEICNNSIIYVKGSNAVGLSKFINHIKKI